MVPAPITRPGVWPRKDPPDVLMVLAHFSPTIGGTESQAQSLAAGLVKAGHRVTVLTSTLQGSPAKEVLDGILVERALCGRGSGVVFALTYGLSLRRHLRRLRSHHAVLHAHHLYLEAINVAWTGMRAGLPAIAKVACGGADGDFARLWRTGLAAALPVLRRLSRVVAISDETEAELVAHGFARGRITRIPNGVDVTRFSPTPDPEAARRATGLGAESVLFLGRVDIQKGLDMALTAWATVARRRPRAQLVLVGDGPVRRELEVRVTNMGLADRVQFLGVRSDRETLLRASQVFLLPSRSEGMSNSLLEAMATGLPCLVTRVGGNQDLVQHGMTGLLVPPGDATALANALLVLLEDAALRTRLGTAARIAAMERFGMDRIVDHYRRLYTALGTGAN